MTAATIAGTLGTFDVSWTLGAILHEASIFVYPSLEPRYKSQLGAEGWHAVLITFSVLALICIILAILALCFACDKGTNDLGERSPLISNISIADSHRAIRFLPF